MLTAYHFTSWTNWLSIRRQGLIPYPIDYQPEIAAELRAGGYDRAIFCFPRPHTGERLAGQVVDRCIVHGGQRLVQLAVRYRSSEALTPAPGVHLGHAGQLQGTSGTMRHPPWVYHVGEPMVLLVARIPPRRLKLVGDYDLVKLIAAGNLSHKRAWSVAPA